MPVPQQQNSHGLNKTCRTSLIISTEIYELSSLELRLRRKRTPLREFLKRFLQYLAAGKTTAVRRASTFCFRSTQSFLLRNPDALHPLSLRQMEACNEVKLQSQKVPLLRHLVQLTNLELMFSPKKAREHKPTRLYNSNTWLE